ncbi:hypothetical protein GGX14DRAFT_569654 [Mycena pura]|uniref:DUF6532 domain-containing protein n=1 Tax=Mycena pura TaxID=153505 RepID=A0AAD6VA75_9AGAR|nr:hypothetical protein GGX14DRAFT_569654 [Mycena pura]
MSLTPQQKAAQTRAANKAKFEQEALVLQESVKGGRSAKATAISDQPWLSGQGANSKKRAAAEAPESGKAKQVKKNDSKPNAKSQRNLPPDIDASDSDNSRPAKSAPAKKAVVVKQSTKGRSTAQSAPPRALQTPVALKKPLTKPVPAPAPQSYAEQSSDGEGEFQNTENSDDSQEEEVEEDEDVDGDQLKNEIPRWAIEDDSRQQTDIDMDNYGVGTGDDYYETSGDVDADEYSAYSKHSRSGSVSSGYDAHIPTSASERGSEAEVDDEESKGRSNTLRTENDFAQHPQSSQISRTRPLPSPSDDENYQSNPRASIPKQWNTEREARRRREPSPVPHRERLPVPHREPSPVMRREPPPPRPQPRRKNPEHTTGQRYEHQPLRQPPHQRERGHEPRHETHWLPQPKATTAKSKSSDVPRQRVISTSREEKALRERPIWSSETSYAASIGTSSSASAAGQARRSAARSIKAAVTQPSSGWPTTPALIFTQRGVLNLGAQDSRIQLLIRNSFKTITGDALFLNGFPDIGDRLQYARDGLYSTSDELGYTDISARLIEDEAYSKEISKVADARWTEIRRGFKTAAIPATIHSFDLKFGCSVRVQALLASPHNDYIYPIKDGMPDYSKPFANPAIVTTIHQVAFMGRRPLATVYQARFPLTDGPEPERMIGKVITCIAASAVCATLQEWQGPVHVSNEFNANLFAETYLVHIGFLEQMEQRSPVAYQKVLSRLYREASGQGKVVAHRATTGANALAHLNFADLEAASD